MGDAFALANFAPADTTTFRLQKHGEHEFVIDGDPDTSDIVLMLRIEQTINDVKTADEQFAAAEEGKALLLRMIQERQPEVTELRAGVREILIIFALIVHGSSVAAMVAEAITPFAAESDDGEERDEETARKEGEHDPEAAEATPLLSRKRSSERSSSSARRDAGLRATGTD